MLKACWLVFRLIQNEQVT